MQSTTHKQKVVKFYYTFRHQDGLLYNFYKHALNQNILNLIFIIFILIVKMKKLPRDEQKWLPFLLPGLYSTSRSHNFQNNVITQKKLAL